MPESTDKIKSSSKRLSFVMLRRGQKVLLRVPVKSLVAGIRSGKIFPTDEFSPDGQHWMPVGRNRQLSKLFIPTRKPLSSGSSELFADEEVKVSNNENKMEENFAPPPHIEEQLSDLAEMFREFNG